LSSGPVFSFLSLATTPPNLAGIDFIFDTKLVDCSKLEVTGLFSLQLFLDLRRLRRKNTRRPSKARPVRPPSTPPTIPPTLGSLLVWEEEEEEEEECSPSPV
jgi:hypothetical protein